MSYVKSFNFMGRWVDTSLTNSEEVKIEEDAQLEHEQIMENCLKDARRIYYYTKMGVRSTLESELSKIDDPALYMSIAIALFEKRANHTFFYREQAARNKFEAQMEREHPTPKRSESIQTINQKSI